MAMNELTPYQKRLVASSIQEHVQILSSDKECFRDNINFRINKIKKLIKNFDEDFNMPEKNISEEIISFSSHFHTSLRKYYDTPSALFLYDIIHSNNKDHLNFLSVFEDYFDEYRDLDEKSEKYALLKKVVVDLYEDRLISNEYFVAWIYFIENN